MGTIYLKGKKEKKQYISTRADGSGVIRINKDAVDVLTGILNELNQRYAVSDLASQLIVAALDNNVIKEEE